MRFFPIEVQVEVDAATLVAGEDGTCSINGRIPLTAETARLLACDAALSAVVTGPNGEVLDIGRRSRTVPSRLRRALERRDHGCVVDGCPRESHLHAHHVVFWADGGPTSLDNLVLLCSFHHRLLHQGLLSVELVDGTPVCRRAGNRLRQRVDPTPMDTDDLNDQLRRLGVPTELSSCASDGERIDWTCAVDGLNGILARATT